MIRIDGKEFEIGYHTVGWLVVWDELFGGLIREWSFSDEAEAREIAAESNGRLVRYEYIEATTKEDIA